MQIIYDRSYKNSLSIYNTWNEIQINLIYLYIVITVNIKQFLLKIYIKNIIAILMKTVKDVCLALRPSVK